MDPIYEALYEIIDVYMDIDEERPKYNCFGTWAMIHFGDVCSLGDKYIQELLREVLALKLGFIGSESMKCNDEEHCTLIEYILDAYENRFLECEHTQPNWAA